MAKTVLNTHIIGEAGVIRFADYCNKHKPYIILREVTKNDFGIDGEIELTRVNEERKIEPTGEIMKIQIKSNASDNSYIQKETSGSFEFNPRKDDLDYWQKYKKNGWEVLLVIYDQRADKLYCKRVIDTDVYIGQQAHKKGTKKNTTAISFDKTENLLEVGQSDFTTKYSSSFKSRVTFGVKEFILTNYLKYNQYPKQMFAYESKFSNKEAIYKVITQDEAPFFIIKNSWVYTATELGKEYSVFKEKVLNSQQVKNISYQQILEDAVFKNYYIELINQFIKSFLWTKRLAYEKKYKRYYFRCPEGQESVVIPAVTRKRGQETERSVVKKYTYGSLTFFRHLAVEIKHFFVGQNLYLIIQPKYFFTADGKNALPPRTITKLTNTLTSQEYNSHFCDWLHFWFSYLSTNDKELVIYEDPAYKNIKTVQKKSFYTNHLRIVTSYYMEFNVDFGIALDIKARTKAVNPDNQPKDNLLFEL